MKRIDSNTVELTEKEMVASRHFDKLLDEGRGVVSATVETKSWMVESGIELHEDFYAYLLS